MVAGTRGRRYMESAVWKHGTVLGTFKVCLPISMTRPVVGLLGTSRSCQADNLARGFLYRGEEGRTDHIVVRGSKVGYKKGSMTRSSLQRHFGIYFLLPFPLLP